jgi:hypothetical protein
MATATSDGSVRGRWLVLGLAVLLSLLYTVLVVVSPHAGGVGADFRIGAWAPVRGLLAGYDPYAADPAYLQQYGVAFPASFHPPWLLLVLAPAALLSFTAGLAVVVVLSVAASWTAAVLVVPPVDRRDLVGCVALGLLLTLTWPGSSGARLGQVAWLAVLGLALVMRSTRAWRGTAGVALLTVHPTFALPFSLLMLGVGRTRAVVRGWLLAVALSVPVLLLATHAAGGFGELLDAVVTGLRDPSAHGLANRVDLVGRVAGGSLVWTALALVVTGGIGWMAHRSRVAAGPVALLWGVTWSLALFYAQPYDLGLLVLASFPVLWRAPRRRLLEWVLVAAYAVLLLQSDLVDYVLVSSTTVDPQRLLEVKAAIDLVVLLVVLGAASVRLWREGEPASVAASG